jgi:hypothetical protein
MLSLVNILILFFIILLFYQLLLASNIVEEFNNKYTPYDTNTNALILSQKNAGNIAYIKERLDSYDDVNKKLDDLSENYDYLEKQVNDLLTAQEDYATQMTGGVAPTITGAEDEEDEKDEDGENDLETDLITE